MMPKLVTLLIQMIEIYSYMLLGWVIGSWFPRFQSTKIYQFLDSAVEPYARVFRGLIPPLGGFDFSIIVAFLVLGIVQAVLAKIPQIFAAQVL
jgi:uncharacterized protein YggT (Ycf19 family)